MIKLTSERKHELLQTSRQAAIALVEDIQHIRELITKTDFTNAEIRRLSGIIRRVIVESDLVAVSAPRLGAVALLGPDNSSFYRAERKRPFLFFMSGRASVLGAWSASIVVLEGGSRAPIHVPEFKMDQTTELTIDTFRTQRVICYRGKWATRKDVIKYVANSASGVHSGVAKTDTELLLSAVRKNVSFRKRQDGNFHIDLFPRGIDVDETQFKHGPDLIDPILIELLAAATFLVKSPFVDELEKSIRSELEGKSA